MEQPDKGKKMTQHLKMANELLTKGDEAYLAKHPEALPLINSFFQSLLIHQPVLFFHANNYLGQHSRLRQALLFQTPRRHAFVQAFSNCGSFRSWQSMVHSLIPIGNTHNRTLERTQFALFGFHFLYNAKEPAWRTARSPLLFHI